MILPPHLLQLTQIFDIGFSFITADNIPAPNWQTNRKYRLTTGEFVKRYTDELSLLGVSFGNETRYAMLDIDRHSPHHPANDPYAYAKLLSALEKIGLVHPVSLRSSHSGGIHIYYFFSRPLKTFRIAALIRVTLINAGFPIKNGHLEIFPNTKPYSPDKTKPTYYKAHRLPLQPNSGASLLDRWGDELLCSVNLTHAHQLKHFLAEAETSAQNNDIDLIDSKIDWAYNLFKTKIAKYQHHSGNYSEIAQEWKENLELSIDIGWTGYHQTNHLIPLFVCYGIVFEELEDKQQLFEWVQQKITTARGYQEYCRHQHEIERKIRDWVNSTIDNQYYIKYCGFPPRCGISPHQILSSLNPKKSKINIHNQTLADRTKQRLTEILAALTELPQKIGDRIAAIQTKCSELFGETISRNTLYKTGYKSIWGEKNPTPPLAIVEANNYQEIQPQSIEPQPQLKNPKTQTQRKLSYTPHPYEAFVPNLEPDPDFRSGESFSSLVSTDSALQPINLTSSLSESEPESTEDSIRSNLQSLDTTSELCILPPQKHSCSERVRSVVEVAIEVRASLPNLGDELLLEFLHHPQQAEIQAILDLADELVSAETRDLVLAVVGDLDRDRKLYLWRVLRVDERTAVAAVMAEAVETSPVIVVGTKLRRNAQRIHGKDYPALVNCEVVAVNGVDWVVSSACGNSFNVSNYSIDSGLWSVESPPSLPIPCSVSVRVASALAATEPPSSLSPFPLPLSPKSSPSCTERSRSIPTIGSTVTTLTGLFGIVKHVFQSAAKPFLVYHESIGRTICYRVDDLRSAS
jgi:hypothetical protein